MDALSIEIAPVTDMQYAIHKHLIDGIEETKVV